MPDGSKSWFLRSKWWFTRSRRWFTHSKKWFVSHATADGDAARTELAALLPADELVFFHQQDPPVTAPLAGEIFDLIGSCDGVIWVESDRSRSRDWVTWEIDTAHRLDRPVHGFRLGDSGIHRQARSAVPFKIYASYTVMDSEAVHPVMTGLRERGVDVFTDATDLAADADISARIKDEIGHAVGGYGFVLLFVSNDSISSEWVMNEITETIAHADRSNFPILPVNVTPGALEGLAVRLPWFAERMWAGDVAIDLHGWPVGRTVDEIMVLAYGIAYRNSGER